MLPLAGSWTIDSLLAPARRARPVRRRRARHARLPRLPPLGVRVGRRGPRAAPGRPLARRRAGPRAAADQLRRLAAARRSAERRAGHAPAGGVSRARSSSSTTRPPGTSELLAALAATGAVESIDFKGAYKGTAVDVETVPDALSPLRRGVPGGVARGPGPDRPGRRRGAAPVPRPHHLGRADPRRRGHRGAAVPAAHDQRQAVAHRQLEEAAAHLRVVRRARRSPTTAAGSPSWASAAARSSTSRRSSTAPRPNDIAPSGYDWADFPATGLPANPLPPDLEPTGFRRRS